MYQLTVFARETLVGTAITVSLSEKDDTGQTEGLAAWSSFCADQFEGLPGFSLESFLEQTSTAVVNALSMGAPRL